MEFFKDSGDCELLGEPVTRPDGRVLSMWRVDGNTLAVALDSPLMTRFGWYEYQEVEQIGQGSFQKGADRIGRAWFYSIDGCQNGQI